MYLFTVIIMNIIIIIIIIINVVLISYERSAWPGRRPRPRSAGRRRSG